MDKVQKFSTVRTL